MIVQWWRRLTQYADSLMADGVARIEKGLSDQRRVLMSMSVMLCTFLIVQAYALLSTEQMRVVELSMFLAAAMALPLAPRLSIACLFILACVDELTPEFNGINRTWVFIIIVALLVFMSSAQTVIAGAVCAEIVCVLGGRMQNEGDVYANHYLIGVCCLVIAVVGVWGQLQRKRMYEMQMSRKLEQHDIIAASLIHDAVSNNLSRIILTSDAMMENAPTDEQRELQAISAYAQEGLQQMRAVVGVLDGTQHDIDIPYMRKVEGIVKRGDSGLQSRGFDGSSILIGTYDGDAHTLITDLALDMLHECYVNIERHADPQCSSYDIMMRFSDDAIVLIATNSTEHSPQWVPPAVSGLGMKLLRKRVADAGGVLRASEDQDAREWCVYCELPLSA